MPDIFTTLHKPDVLSCLSDLSNDEVFTPPNIVNDMLDLLPQELFEDPNTTFLDPVCKSGVFLREIAKRLIKGLANKIPDLQQRLDHIFHKQLFGIAITELTSLLSRRSVYCSKYPNSPFSVSTFENIAGNIRYKHIAHEWVKGKCCFCGATESEYGAIKRDGMESHAYEFIHTTKPQEIFNMKFDVIIGNPPYQMSLGNTGGNASKANAIYHKFIEQALKCKPKYIAMIIPSRWMTRTAEGVPDDWIDYMINSNKIKELHDYLNSADVFPGIDIGGGVCYFLLDTNYQGVCDFYSHSSCLIDHYCDYLNSKNMDVVLRDPNSHSIIEKIEKVENAYYLNEDSNFSSLVSPKNYFSDTNKLTSSWKGFQYHKDTSHYIRYYCSKNMCKEEYCYIRHEDVARNHQTIPLNKVYISAAYGERGNGPYLILGKPFYGECDSACSQTYLVIGYNHNLSKQQCLNIITYIKTRFFRYLVGLKKKTQNGPRGVYQFVPLQDFSKPWTDEELYKKYNFSQEEIDFIESTIRPME